MIRILELEDALKNETSPVARSAIQGEINNLLLKEMEANGFSASETLFAIKARRQPAPTNETKGYEGSVLECITRDATEGSELRAALPALTERAKFGYEKYGTYLHPHNGRSALLDARDELLDAVMYLVQDAMESEGQGMSDVERDLIHNTLNATSNVLEIIRTKNAK